MKKKETKIIEVATRITDFFENQGLMFGDTPQGKPWGFFLNKVKNSFSCFIEDHLFFLFRKNMNLIFSTGVTSRMSYGSF